MQWINRLFKRVQKGSLPMGPRELSASQAEKLLKLIQKTQEVELSCDEAHKLLDQYSEMALRGEDAAGLLPQVRRHLELCLDCMEEYEALTRILQAQVG